MRKRPSVAPNIKPYRIAILLPKVAIEGADAAYGCEVALLLWAACYEACQRHPQLAVLDLSAPLVRRDGHLMPDVGVSGLDFECLPPPQSKASPFFAAARRDDVIRLELALGPTRGVVRLHSATRDGAQRTFEANGGTVGAQIHKVLAAWLTSRGFEPIGPIGGVEPPNTGFDAVTADDILGAARVLAPSAAGKSVIDLVAPALQAPAKRVFDLAVHGQVRVADVEDALAQLPAFQAGTDLPLDREGLAAVAAAGLAIVWRPESLEMLEVAADRLVRADRFDEALRLVERGVRLYSDDPRAHIALLRTLESSERLGARLEQAMASSRRHGCPSVSELPSGSHQIEIDLRASSALASVGRLDDAIALRASRLADRHASWRGQARLLERWRNEPRFLAQSYAREAYCRGDLARVLEAFSFTPPADSVDLAMWLEALVAAGHEHEASLAWGQFGLGYGCDAPIARLAAVHALVAAGQFRLGLEELWRVELAAPCSSDATSVARCGVVLAGVPTEVFEAAIGERIASGAHTLARRMARIVADYVPAAATSTMIERALAKRTAIEFDDAWLAGFSAYGDRPTTGNVDRLFVELGPMRTGLPAEADPAAELARGDRLVMAWLGAVFRDAANGDDASVPPTHASSGPEDDPHGLVRVAAYAAAQALARYLAATTLPASPIAGALRTVASEALALVYAHRAALADDDARAVLIAIEPVLRRVDRWVGAAWLATLERCLALDERAAGDLSGFVGDLPTVAARILGPEEIALLSWSVVRLHRERPDGWAAKVGALASRLAMHVGTAGLDEWADATAAQLAARELDLTPHSLAGSAAHPGRAGVIEFDDGLDSLLTACYLAEGVTAGPCVHAALMLFGAGRGQEAFDVLTRGFAAAHDRDEAEREQQLGRLREAWFRASLDVPFDLTGGTAPLFEALRNRDPVHCERLGRWAVAFDPSDDEAHRNLGSALAAQRNTVAAMHHLVRGTRDQATEILAVALNKADFLDEAKNVLGYASRWGAQFRFIRSPVIGRERSLTSESGHDDTAERYSSIRAAEDARPRAEAPRTTVPLRAEDVVSSSEVPSTTVPLRAEDVVSASAAPHDSPHLLLELGDYTAAAARLGDTSWRVRSAALQALRFRTNAENHVDVTQRARRGADVILAESVGVGDPSARCARAVALKIREQAHFARDPVPVLGDRMTRATFDRELRIRSGESVTDEPPPERGSAAHPGDPGKSLMTLGNPRRPLEVPDEGRGTRDGAGVIDRVVLSNSHVARISDYVALLRDLAQLPPDEALAQFDIDAAGYLEVARAWTAAMQADPTIKAMVEARLARR